jgi:predicted nucleic acid-binding protein
MTPVLVDTGFLVALFDPADALAAPAAIYLQEHRHRLVATTATVVEACFFLSPRAKADLLAWIRRGGVSVLDVPAAAYVQLEMTLRKYSDQEIDFADAALIWLAGETGATQVLTVDRKDFEIFRLKGGKRFEVIDWF